MGYASPLHKMAWLARLFCSVCWLLLLPSRGVLAEAGNREEKVESDYYVAKQADQRFTMLWAAAELEVEEETPTEPGCYFKMRSGCPSHPNVAEAKWDNAKWKHDGFGERKRHAGRLQDVCEQVRKGDFDAFCGIEDTVMTFVPKTTELDTNHETCVPHEDDQWLSEDQLRSQFNQMTVEDILTKNIVYIRHNADCPGHPQYFVKSAGQSFADYRFVPASDPAGDSTAPQGDGAKIVKARGHSARASTAAFKANVPEVHDLELIHRAPRSRFHKGLRIHKRPKKHVSERPVHKVPRKALAKRRRRRLLLKKKTVLADSLSESFDEGHSIPKQKKVFADSLSDSSDEVRARVHSFRR